LTNNAKAAAHEKNKGGENVSSGHKGTSDDPRKNRGGEKASSQSGENPSSESQKKTAKEHC